jgi:hypothetical protein
MNPKDETTRGNVRDEYLLLSKLKHQHILKCLDSMKIGGDRIGVIELAQKGDLPNYLREYLRTRRMSDMDSKEFFCQIMEALRYMVCLLYVVGLDALYQRNHLPLAWRSGHDKFKNG